MKRLVWLTVALFIIVIAFWIIMPKGSKTVTEKDARLFVLDDLKHRYPNGSYEILSVRLDTNHTGPGKHYTVKAKVTLNPDSPCPERIHLYYDYPEQGYVTQPPDYITKDCKIWGGPGAPIIYEEEAVIASHTFPSTDDVHDYITQYNASHDVTLDEKTGVWTVTWYSEQADYRYIVKVASNGTIVSVEPEFNS